MAFIKDKAPFMWSFFFAITLFGTLIADLPGQV
jgi:hypothetical protein